MPKMKTNKSTSKRFRRTKGGKGKLVRTRQGKSHLRRKKSKRAKRPYDKMVVVGDARVRKRVRRPARCLHDKQGVDGSDDHPHEGWKGRTQAVLSDRDAQSAARTGEEVASALSLVE